MKTYIKPTLEVIKMQTAQLIAASGDTRPGDVYNETIDDITFGSRSDDFDE